MKAYTYLLIDFACIIIPFLASFYKPHSFYKTWKQFFIACLIIGAAFLLWDHYFTIAGIWGFNPEYLTGIYLGVLPLEEILFFVCIPYACVFTYFALEFLVKTNPLQNFQGYITLSLAIILGALAVMYYDRWYTAVTFFSTAIYLIVQLFLKKSTAYTYLAFLVILPFFFISNGILTGSLLDAPIVWYNDEENMGFRMGSIPFEDTFYGFLLITMNIDLYNYLRDKAQIRK